MQYQCATRSLRTIAPGASATLKYRNWFGPKSPELLKAYDAKLEESLDLGILARISMLLFSALSWLHGALGNWGLAIIVCTLALKVGFYPLTRQAAMSAHRMKKMQPEMNRLKEKYKEDPKRQQQELMKFMSTNKINPMRGCLPVLAQLPVFIAFYRVLSTSIELRHAPFYGWITDLAIADPYFVTPLILGVTMFVQQKITPTTGLDKTQERIMLMIPLILP